MWTGQRENREADRWVSSKGEGGEERRLNSVEEFRRR